MNYFLLDVCLEYLRQPIALKEEGLFRVPGDSSSIKSMHAQFLGGTVNASQLRYDGRDGGVCDVWRVEGWRGL